MDTNNLFPLYHNDGFCKNVAFYTVKVFSSGEVVHGSDVFRLDGTHPVDGEDPAICGSCGKYVHLLELSYKNPRAL